MEPNHNLKLAMYHLFMLPRTGAHETAKEAVRHLRMLADFVENGGHAPRVEEVIQRVSELIELRKAGS